MPPVVTLVVSLVTLALAALSFWVACRTSGAVQDDREDLVNLSRQVNNDIAHLESLRGEIQAETALLNAKALSLRPPLGLHRHGGSGPN